MISISVTKNGCPAMEKDKLRKDGKKLIINLIIQNLQFTFQD